LSEPPPNDGREDRVRDLPAGGVLGGVQRLAGAGVLGCELRQQARAGRQAVSPVGSRRGGVPHGLDPLARRKPRFALELFAKFLVNKKRFLQRDHSIQPLINSFVHGAHSALSQLADDPISAL